MQLKFILLMAISMLIFACDKNNETDLEHKRVDGTSAETYEKSLADIQLSLSPSERQRFQDAIALLELTESLDSASPISTRVAIHGMTFNEIFKRATEQSDRLENKINLAANAWAPLMNALNQLNDLITVDSYTRTEDDRYILIKLTNNSEKPIGALTLKFTIYDAFGTATIHREAVNVKLDSTIQPKEQREIQLAPDAKNELQAFYKASRITLIDAFDDKYRQLVEMKPPTSEQVHQYEKLVGIYQRLSTKSDVNPPAIDVLSREHLILPDPIEQVLKHVPTSAEIRAKNVEAYAKERSGHKEPSWPKECDEEYTAALNNAHHITDTKMWILYKKKIDAAFNVCISKK